MGWLWAGHTDPERANYFTIPNGSATTRPLALFQKFCSTKPYSGRFLMKGSSMALADGSSQSACSSHASAKVVASSAPALAIRDIAASASYRFQAPHASTTG